jgi:hypothetical protein
MADDRSSSPSENEPQPVTWNDLNHSFIRRFTRDRFEIEDLALVSKEELIDYLTSRGITPSVLLGAPLRPITTTMPLPSQVRARLELPRQSPQETIDAFLRRADAFFTLEAVPNDRRLTFLLTAVSPSVGQLIADLVASGVTDYETVRALILKTFQPSVFQRLSNFRAISRLGGESNVELGRRLRAEYLAYLQLDEASLTADLESVVVRALLAQFLLLLPIPARQHLQHLFLTTPSMTWHDITRQADEFFHSQQATKSHSTFQRSKGKPGDTSGRPTGPSSTPSRTSPTCFSCHQLGHLAPDCPTRRQPPSGSGNRPPSR